MIDREELLAFTDEFLRSLEAAVVRYLRRPFDVVFRAQRTLTAGDAYLVGDKYFYYDMKVTDYAFKTLSIFPLHDSLREQHATWYRMFSDYQSDANKIRQTLASILLRAKSWQDVRDMFPEYVIRPVLHQPVLHSLTRTRPDLSTAAPDWEPHLVTMYKRVGGMIDLYVGYQLL